LTVPFVNFIGPYTTPSSESARPPSKKLMRGCGDLLLDRFAQTNGGVDIDTSRHGI
jgi:hypothetical protein